MTKLLTIGLVAMFACAPAFAADTKAAPATTTTTTPAAATATTTAPDTKTNSQQSKMATCQAQAGEKKLESTARQDYVNNCLKAKPVAEKPKSKMAMCNEKTKGMVKADADKARSECMKG
jgi:psiF repeat